MNALSKVDNEVLESLKWWLDDNVDQGTDIAFDNDGKVKSSQCLKVLSKLIKTLSPTPFTNKTKKLAKVKQSRGYDCMRCSICDQNDNFVIMIDGTVECANCGDTKGHLVFHQENKGEHSQ